MAAPPQPALWTGDLFAADLGSTDDAPPTLVEALRGEHILEMSGGFARTLILTGKGVARRAVPGSQEAAPVAELSGLDGMLAQVAFGSKHIAALTHSGQVYTLGVGAEGQLGHGNTANCAEPRLVESLASRPVAQVACGKSHSIGLTAEGDVYTWGAGDEGQLGTGRTAPAYVPRYLSALQGTPVAMISAGAAHCAALSVYGRIYTWGEARCGQLGLGKPLTSQTLPVEVGPTSEAGVELPDCRAVACGEFHTVGLTAEGEVYAWGLATRGPPTSRKSTPLPERVDGLPERVRSVACGGGSTLLIGESGSVLCWPGSGKELATMPIPKPLRASRAACSGSGALVFVETAITTITPSVAPLQGGSRLVLAGAGFYTSDGIVLRLTHEGTGEQKLVRGTLSRDEASGGSLTVIADAPEFLKSPSGTVSVAASFEEGEGDTFTSVPVMMRVYSPPTITSAVPCCAPAAEPTSILLTASSADALFDSPDAKCFFVDGSTGEHLATVDAIYSAQEGGMRVTTPALATAHPNAYMQLALDGQTAAPSKTKIVLHAPISLAALMPRCGPFKGGTKISLQGDNLFDSPHIAARFTVLPPPPPPPTPPPAASPEPPAEGEGEGEGEAAAPPAEEAATGEGEGEGEGEEVAPVVPMEPPPKQLEEGLVFVVDGAYNPSTGAIDFTMPVSEGVGDLRMELTVDSVHYLPSPSAFTLHAPLSLASLSPPVGSLNGGSKVTIGGANLFDSPDMAVLFVKAHTRIVVPAAYDASTGCAVCAAPKWPPALAVAKAAAESAKAAAAAAEEGAEPEPVAPLDLTDAGDAIVEVSLNGQQWTTDCKHFTFCPDSSVAAADPPSGPIEGGGAVKITGTGIVDTGFGKARFVRLPPPPEGEENSALPDDSSLWEGVIEVDVAVNADDGSVDVTSPVFEGVEEPFACALQYANDGQTYGQTYALFKYEAAGGKGGKKK